MALAQFLTIKEYEQFFVEKVKAGETVILDNGAYEGVQMAPAMLDRWVRRIKPSVVVLPDAPHDLLKTVQKSMQYLEEFGLPYGTEGMMVLHAEDSKPTHFITAYELCPTKWVGFSRLTKSFVASYSERWQDQRSLFAETLQVCGYWRKELHHHALGMLNGYVQEMKYLNRLGFQSCDSSAPIWRGLHGYSMDDTWPGYEFQAVASEEASNWNQAETNLKGVLKACGQD